MTPVGNNILKIQLIAMDAIQSLLQSSQSCRWFNICMFHIVTTSTPNHLESLNTHSPSSLVSVEKWVGKLVRRAAEEAHKVKNKNEIRITFTSIILKEYRKFLIQMSKVKGIGIQNIEKVFSNSCNKSMEFLQDQYLHLRKRTGDLGLADTIEMTSSKICEKYDILRRAKFQLNLSNREDLRMDIKKMVNMLITHSISAYKPFKKTMRSLFSEMEEGQQGQESTFTYNIDKKIKTERVYNSKELSNPGFSVESEQITKILMRWTKKMFSFFKDPTKILENRYGFWTKENEIKKVSLKDKQQLWKSFEQQFSKMDEALTNGETFLRRTISNIILVSGNEIKTPQGRSVEYLDKEEVSLIVACEYLSKSLNDYIIDTLVTLLMGINEAGSSFHRASSDLDLQLVTFTLGNLFRCRCAGTKEEILKVYSLIRAREDIEIVRVTNKLNLPNCDILVNFVFRDPEMCFFICEMQLIVSHSVDIEYSLSDFLKARSSSPCDMIAQLGLIFHQIDTRKEYLKSHRILFSRGRSSFRLNKGTVSCMKHQELTKQQNGKSYICNNCCNFIEAYQYYFYPKSCGQCHQNICPICEFQMYQRQQMIEVLSVVVPYLKDYFLVAECCPFFYLSTKKLASHIKQQLREHQYVVVLYFKNHKNCYNVVTLKALDALKKETSHQNYQKPKKTLFPIKYAFSNEEFDFQTLEDSLVLVLTYPQGNTHLVSSEEFISSKASNYQSINAIQQNFDPQRHGILYSVKPLAGKNTTRELILDYFIDPQEMEEMISDNKIKSLVELINQSKRREETLTLSGVALHLEELKQINNKDRINHLQLWNGFIHSKYEPQQQFQILNLFSKTRVLLMQSSQVFQIKFIDLKEIYIINCKLRTFDFGLYPQAETIELRANHLQIPFPTLDLPNLRMLDLSLNKIYSLKNLSACTLPMIDHINVEYNICTGQFPIISFPNLRVLNVALNSLTSINNLVSCCLPKLKYLLIRRNMLQGLLPDIGNFPQLEYLRANHNELTQISPMCHNQMKSLELQFNKLKRLPKLELNSLDILNLNGNKLDEYDNIEELLTVLHGGTIELGSNSFHSLPLVKTSVRTIKVERKKLLLEIENLWENDKRDTFVCDKCSEIITSPGVYSNITQEKDYHKQCYEELSPDQRLGVDLFVEISGEYLNKNI